MYRVPIKPLSVNRSYQGRRFATPELKAYKEALGYLLPVIKVPQGKLKVHYIFGFSSRASDLDNAVKSFQDSLCEQYSFNDRDIYELTAQKVIVPKGEEFAAFSIETIDSHSNA